MWRGERGVASRQRLSAERPQQRSVLETMTVIGITRFQSGVSWHFRSLKDEVLKIESLARIKITGMLGFSPCARTNLNLSAKISPFLRIWEAGKISRRRALTKRDSGSSRAYGVVSG